MIVEAGPATVDFAAFDIAAEDEHGVGVAMVGAAGTVFAGRAAELRHGNEGDVFRAVAEVAPKGGDGGGEVAKTVGELAFCTALIVMGVPALDVGESSFNTEIGLEKLGDLAACCCRSPRRDNRRLGRACIARGLRPGAS